MKDLWYGDRRDKVKWGATSVLARRFKCQAIHHIAFLQRASTDDLKMTVDGQPRQYPRDVWETLSDITRVREIGAALGIPISVFDKLYEPSSGRARQGYFRSVETLVKRCRKRPILLLMDPHTGITPSGRATAKHVSAEEIALIWRALRPKDVLCIYQHAARDQQWRKHRRETLSAACDDAHVVEVLATGVAADVAMLAVRK